MESDSNRTDSSQEETEEQDEQDRELERLLSTAGYGFFHVLLLLMSALPVAAEAVETLAVPFVVPIAGGDLDLTTTRIGYLNAGVFIGILIGHYLCGSLADVLGRKRILLLASLLNGVCGLVSAFSPNFLSFFFLRMLSGIANGGTLPVICTYLPEFYPEKRRGQMIITLCTFWASGVVYVALLAWGLLGTESSYYAIDFYIGSLHFSNWRLYLIILTFPVFLLAFLLLFMPESPAYLFQVGQMEALKKVLVQIHKVNSACCCWVQRPTVERIPLLASESDKEEVEQSPLSSPTPHSTSEGPLALRLKKMIHFLYLKVTQLTIANIALFRRKYLRITILLTVIHITMYFGYDGLIMWLPEYFKKLSSCSETTSDISDYNSTSMKTNLLYYQDTLYVAIASIPGGIAALLLIGLTGGRILLVFSTFTCALCAFLIWGVSNSYAAVVGVSALFCAGAIQSFGALTLVMANAYDPGVRATSFGVFLAMEKTGAILGNLTFGYLLDVDSAIPILISASFITVAAIAAIFLPPTYRPENHPPLEKAISGFMARIC